VNEGLIIGTAGPVDNSLSKIPPRVVFSGWVFARELWKRREEKRRITISRILKHVSV
jgi:hypothetical protein